MQLRYSGAAYRKRPNEVPDRGLADSIAGRTQNWARASWCRLPQNSTNQGLGRSSVGSLSRIDWLSSRVLTCIVPCSLTNRNLSRSSVEGSRGTGWARRGRSSFPGPKAEYFGCSHFRNRCMEFGKRAKPGWKTCFCVGLAGSQSPRD